MELSELLPPEHIVVPLDAPGVRAGLEQLLDRLVSAGGVADPDRLRQRVRTEPLREVVGVNEDVLLAHFRSDDVAAVRLALGIARQPIASGEPALEVQPRILALILAPQDAAPLYLQAASSLARLLRQPGTVNTLIAQPDARAVAALPELHAMRIRPRLAVRDVMTHRVHTVGPDATIRHALTLMLRRRARAVPIVGSKGELLGMVTEADVMRALLPQIPRVGSDEDGDSAALDRPVREIMTRSVLCVSEDLGVGEAASMMINKNVQQLPVVQAGNITGMVSRGDIIRKLFYRP
jgi:CBS domain-containing protein/mannitol/fructose-specific phosphotransferase system IIA component (Ntr-type)